MNDNMSIFRQLAAFNNDGVANLLQGDYKSAIESMGIAVKLLQAKMIKTRETTNTPKKSTTTTTTTRCSNQSLQTEMVEIPSMASCECIACNRSR